MQSGWRHGHCKLQPLQRRDRLKTRTSCSTVKKVRGDGSIAPEGTSVATSYQEGVWIGHLSSPKRRSLTIICGQFTASCRPLPPSCLQRSWIVLSEEGTASPLHASPAESPPPPRLSVTRDVCRPLRPDQSSPAVRPAVRPVARVGKNSDSKQGRQFIVLVCVVFFMHHPSTKSCRAQFESGTVWSDEHIALATQCLGHTVPHTCVPSAPPWGSFFHAINSHL